MYLGVVMKPADGQGPLLSYVTSLQEPIMAPSAETWLKKMRILFICFGGGKGKCTGHP